MAICYVKAYYDWIEQTAALSDAERGRLFISILEYARSGLEPKLDGRESILFPAFKSQLDRDKKNAEINAENGKKGGRPKTEDNPNKPKITEDNRTKGNKDKEEDKDKEKDKDIKLIYGEYRHVKLSQTEFDKLGADLGSSMRDACINYLDAYIEEKGYKSKSHNLCIRRWVIDAVKEQNKKSGKTIPIVKPQVVSELPKSIRRNA